MVNGDVFEQMFSDLPKARSSASAVPPTQWVEGLRDNEYVAYNMTNYRSNGVCFWRILAVDA